MEYVLIFVLGVGVGYYSAKWPKKPKNEEIDVSPSFFHKVKHKHKPKINNDEKAYENERLKG